MSAQSPMLQQANMLTGRQMVMLAVIALHALLISALMTMRIMPDAQKQVDPITVTFDPPTVKPLPPPPDIPVPRTTGPTLPTVPAPNVIIPAEETTPRYVEPTETGPVEPVAPQTGTGVDIAPAIPSTPLQFRAVRPSDDYYPPASIRLQEVGTAIVKVCVTPAGKLDGNPVIQTSSGSARLDAAALKWAGEALRFTPATRGGVAVAACKGFRVNFTLH